MSLNRKKEKHFETGEESSDELYGENGSEDFDTNSEDSAENFKEMLLHENKLTKQYWLPQEPSMYVLAVGNVRVDYDFEQAIDRATGGAVSLIRSKPERMVSEELGLKEIRNFTQEMLRADGVYLLDFESEAFIWVGKNAPKDVITESYVMALRAMENVHCCGKERIKRVTLSLVNYAYEP